MSRDDMQSDLLRPVTLRGERVTLVPLSIDHDDDLKLAVQDGELWKLWYTTAPSPEEMQTAVTHNPALADQGVSPGIPVRAIQYVVRGMNDMIDRAQRLDGLVGGRLHRGLIADVRRHAYKSYWEERF